MTAKDVIINPVGMSCGASIGPGLCSVYFIGDPVSENNTNEKQWFSESVNTNKN